VWRDIYWFSATITSLQMCGLLRASAGSYRSLWIPHWASQLSVPQSNLNILFKLSWKRPFVGTQTSIRKLTSNLAKFRFDRHVIIRYSVFNRQRQAASCNVNTALQAYNSKARCKRLETKEVFEVSRSVLQALFSSIAKIHTFVGPSKAPQLLIEKHSIRKSIGTHPERIPFP
jgi:hypothetical protein